MRISTHMEISLSISIFPLWCYNECGYFYRNFHPMRVTTGLKTPFRGEGGEEAHPVTKIARSTTQSKSSSAAAEEELVSGPQIARGVKVDPATVRRWRKEGMPHHLLGFGLVRYKMAEVLAWRARRPSITKVQNDEARADQKTDSVRVSNRSARQETESNPVTVELSKLCPKCQAALQRSAK